MKKTHPLHVLARFKCDFSVHERQQQLLVIFLSINCHAKRMGCSTDAQWRLLEFDIFAFQCLEVIECADNGYARPLRRLECVHGLLEYSSGASLERVTKNHIWGIYLLPNLFKILDPICCFKLVTFFLSVITWQGFDCPDFTL